MGINRHKTQVVVALALSIVGGRLDAQQQVSQTVRIEVVAVNRAVATAVAAPVARGRSAAAALGTLSLTTSEANQKVTASLDRPLPAGMKLSVVIAPAGRAEGVGRALLSADTATDVVATVPTGESGPMPVHFVVSGGDASRVVTYTVVGAP